MLPSPGRPAGLSNRTPLSRMQPLPAIAKRGYPLTGNLWSCGACPTISARPLLALPPVRMRCREHIPLASDLARRRRVATSKACLEDVDTQP
jgi:hypothetical protein